MEDCAVHIRRFSSEIEGESDQNSQHCNSNVPCNVVPHGLNSRHATEKTNENLLEEMNSSVLAAGFGDPMLGILQMIFLNISKIR